MACASSLRFALARLALASGEPTNPVMPPGAAFSSAVVNHRFMGNSFYPHSPLDISPHRFCGSPRRPTARASAAPRSAAERRQVQAQVGRIVKPFRNFKCTLVSLYPEPLVLHILLQILVNQQGEILRIPLTPHRLGYQYQSILLRQCIQHLRSR